jgi:Domain of unknown function (DUF4407)
MENLDVHPRKKAGPITRLLLKIAAVDEETLQKCPRHDWDNAKAVAEIQIAVWAYQTLVFSITAHLLFARRGEVRPEFIIGSSLIAAFILIIDSYMVMRSGWHLSGIQELKRGGIDISGGIGPRVKSWAMLAVRVSLAIVIAQLTAMFFALFIFNADINARVDETYQRANAKLIEPTTTSVDAEIRRASDAVRAQTDRVSALSAQVAAVRQIAVDPSENDPRTRLARDEVTKLLARQEKAEEDVRSAEAFAANELAGIKGTIGNSGQAGNGPRHQAALEMVTNAKRRLREITDALTAARGRLDASSQSNAVTKDPQKQNQDRLQTFEATLAAEDASLTSLRSRLSELTAERENNIRKMVEAAPDHVARDEGLLARISVLERMAQADSKIAAVIFLIDLTAFGFELAAVLAKMTSYVPTTYAALLARNAYMRIVRIVDEMTHELNESDGGGPQAPVPPFYAGPANDNLNEEPAAESEIFGDLDETPPKRPRGRPRKSTIN